MNPSQIFLQSISGGTKVLHDVSTLSQLRQAVSEHEGLPSSELRLSHGTRSLPAEGDALLSELGILDGANIQALARLLGGGKKRKKKTYTKPKKIKHKHKTVKLAVLKYYKIHPDGKVERLRRECPNETCGAGVFMAAHADRVYCGKCSSTYAQA